MGFESPNMIQSLLQQRCYQTYMTGLNGYNARYIDMDTSTIVI